MSSTHRKRIILHEDDEDLSAGTAPDRRPIETLLQYGLIPIDKPAGPTSHEVVAWVRKILNIEKAGHSGTLDPPVTGLLPVGIGDATKALSVLLLGPKEYVAVARLHDPVNDEKLRQVIKEFTGEIFQRPPQRSSVRRVTRVRRIYELEVKETVGRLLLLRIVCEAGTYVRKLVYDIGEVLGPGATMVELRRTRVSHLTEDLVFVKLHELLDAVQTWKENGSEVKLRSIIRPVEHIILGMKSLSIRNSAVDAICHGAQLAVPGILSLSDDIVKGDGVSILTSKGELVALGDALMSSEEVKQAEKGIAVSTKRVIMKAGSYPRMWKAKPKIEASL